MRLGRISHGPLFRPIARKNGGVSPERLTDKHVARLVQKTALAAGIRGDLSEGERRSPSPATPCAPASPPRRRSTRRMSKNISATPPPR